MREREKGGEDEGRGNGGEDRGEQVRWGKEDG